MILSIIIPVFNEKNTIQKVLNEATGLVIPECSIEIIVVDDGSNDGTVEEINRFSLNNSQVSLKKIFHPKNLGKGAALKSGLKQATGDYIVVQDADLEYNPKDIIRLLEPIQAKKSQVVYGTRLKRLPNLKRDERIPILLIHYFGNKCLSLITSILYGQWITDMETGYKLFPRVALNDINLSARGFEFEPEITAKLIKKGYHIHEIPIQTNPRSYAEGKKLNTVKDGLKAVWCLLKYRFTD